MIGKSFGHYRIVGRIGKGGMGEVFLGEDTALHRKVALKFLPDELADSPESRARFLVEARAAAALSHPNICVVHEVGVARFRDEDAAATEAGAADDAEVPDHASEWDSIDESGSGASAATDEDAGAGRPFIAMEYLEGETLHDKLKAGSLSFQEADAILHQVLNGLEAAHAQGIVHRDIKSQNIMVTPRGQAKILDFGLAKVRGGRTLTKDVDTLGTVAYMSPEQAENANVDPRSDLWSVGVVLYEMLSGTLPFRGSRETVVLHHILYEEPEPLPELKPSIPKELRNIVARALQKDPDDRYPSATEMLAELRGYEAGVLAETVGIFNVRSLVRRLRNPAVGIPAAAAVVALIAFTSWYGRRQAEVRRIREEVMPAIAEMAAQSDLMRDMDEPYLLVEQAEMVLGEDPELAELASRVSLNIDILTDPEGAQVYRKPYDDPDAEWTFIGTTPIEGIRVPIDVFRWRIEKDGYAPVMAVASSWDIAPNLNGVVGNSLVRTLDPVSDIPEGMIRVPGSDGPQGSVPDFFIGRYEVTNRQYKAFVDAGGYRSPEYWTHPFVQDTRTLDRDLALARFVDRTGLPGPATWEGGGYPPGQEDYPVSGVSWYEAAAYAEWAGSELPTAVHWAVAGGRRTPLLQWYQLGGMTTLAPFSNFDSPGPLAVGSRPSLSAYGTYDMPGNVREWCLNDAEGGRIVRGGAWSDNPYSFYNVTALPPMDRSPQNGFRVARYPDRSAVDPAHFGPFAFPATRDLRSQEPVSDEIFQVYRDQFTYDPTPLNSVVEIREESPRGWIREKVSYEAAYGGERIVGYLHLPKDVEPPYSVVVYFPGSQAMAGGDRDHLDDWLEFNVFVSFLPAAGRAVLYPTFLGTFQRFDPSHVPMNDPGPSRAFSDYTVQLVQDFMRSVDYLETRDDIDTDRLAFYGMSLGGAAGTMIPAVDERVRAVVLLAGGIVPEVDMQPRPEADLWNYVSRVRQPTLMINGRYDTGFGLEKGVLPVFEALGSPEQDKALKLYDTDHIPPRPDFIRDILGWLDRYLGPVR
jgi:serine/threonine protein kinase/dienelactone hydrolase